MLLTGLQSAPGRWLSSILSICTCALLVACSDGSDSITSRDSTLGVPGADNSGVMTVAPASVQGPIPGTPVLVGTFIDLPDLGYTVETEYFISGTASAYVNVNELGADGKWQVEPGEQAQYNTRVVVIRPLDPSDFNGTVFVEWLNVSAGFDSGPDWNMMHTELIRQGYAWVGVSAQKTGVDALVSGKAAAIVPGGDVPGTADRYKSLFHPGDAYVYDIYSQVAQALREPGAVSIMAGLQVERLIGAGESQSAGRLLTYVNAFAPIHALFEGYFIHSRTLGSAGLQQDESFCEADIPTPAIVRVRDDLGTPVMMLQTETDLFVLGSYTSNQEDSDRFRLWEVAGTAHADLYTFVENRFDIGTDPAVAAIREVKDPVPFIIDCEVPVNSGPQHFVANAALRALNAWIVDGTPPPRADRLDVAGEPAAFVQDERGNTLGGVRTPYVDVPIAVLEGEDQPQPDFEDLCDISVETVDFCFLSGTTRLFDAATLGSLYEDNAAYIEAVNRSTDEAVEKGFLVPEDAQLIKDYAASTDIFAPANP